MCPGLAYIKTNRFFLTLPDLLHLLQGYFTGIMCRTVSLSISAFQTFCVSDTLLNQK